MSDRAALIAAIAAAPDDDLPRLVFADWLEEHGEPARAEFIRACVEVAGYQYGDPRAIPAADRAEALFQEHWLEWVRPLLLALTGSPGPEFRNHRGQGYKLIPAPRADRWERFGVAVDLSHRVFHAGYPSAIGFSRGLIDSICLMPRDDPGAGSLAAALGVEPITTLGIRGCENPGEWGRLSGPWLKSLRSLYLIFSGASPRVFLESVISTPGLESVTHLGLTGSMRAGRILGLPAGAASRLAWSAMLGRVRSLDLRANPDDIHALGSGRSAQGVTKLTVRTGSRPANAGASELADAIATFRRGLESLDAGVNQLADAGVLRLLELDWPRLQRLTLSRNGLGPFAAELIAAARLPELRELDLGHYDRVRPGTEHFWADPRFQTDLRRTANRLGDEGGVNLAPLAARLAQLRLRSTGIGDRGALALADAIDPSRLEWLDLSRNPISSGVANQLRERFGPRVLVD